MFHTPGHCFVAKLSVGREVGSFLLAAANSNSRGTKFNRRPGNESDEALSNGESLQGAETWQQIGAPAERIVSRLKEKAGREAPGEEVRNLPASNTAQGGARRAVNS